jgi:hypothetical protein
MVYIAGQPHHRLKDQGIVDHLVELVEAKAAGLAMRSPSPADAAGEGGEAKLEPGEGPLTLPSLARWAPPLFPPRGRGISAWVATAPSHRV